MFDGILGLIAAVLILNALSNIADTLRQIKNSLDGLYTITQKATLPTVQATILARTIPRPKVDFVELVGDRILVYPKLGWQREALEDELAAFNGVCII